jgi:hypothetical protein
MDVLESEHLLQARLANTVAMAALHASPEADVRKGAEIVGRLYTTALDSIPYIQTGSSEGQTQGTNDREAAINRYKELRDTLEQERQKIDQDMRSKSQKKPGKLDV